MRKKISDFGVRELSHAANFPAAGMTETLDTQAWFQVLRMIREST